jgi:hypothetical protein
MSKIKPMGMRFNNIEDIANWIDYIDLCDCFTDLQMMEMAQAELLRVHLEAVLPIYERIKACVKN